MKKLLLLFFAVTLLSCSSDESEPVNNHQMEFKGMWRKTAIINQGESDILSIDCNNREEIDKYRFDNFSEGACYLTNACDDESEIKFLSFQYDSNPNKMYIGYLDSPIDNYLELYTVTYYDDTKFGFKMTWNTVDGDVENGKYFILERTGN